MTRAADAPNPSLPLERYAGSYVDSTYGAVEVTLQNGALQARFGKEELGTLEPWGFESFRATGPAPEAGQTMFSFVRNGDRVTALQLFGVTFARAATATP